MAAGRLTSGQRCSRRRLDDEGGAPSVFTAASCSGSAPLPLRTAPASSDSSRPRRSPAAARRQRRDTQLAPPRLHSPGPFPLAAAHTREREKTQRELVGCNCDLGLPCEGRKGRAHWPMWLHTSGGQASFGVTGQGQKGSFSLAESPGWVPRARRPRRACQLSARPSHPRAQPRREPAGAMRIRGEGEKVRLGETSWPTRGPRLSARDRKQRKDKVWWAAVWSGLGRLERKGKGKRPTSRFGFG
jgi:hypothetical protein